MQGVNGRPLLQLDRIGDGRVALLLSDHAWLWARGAEGGGPQAELLRRLAHWLMKEPDLEEEDLRLSARGNRLEITRRSLDDLPAQITVSAPSGEQLRVTLADQGGGRAFGTATVTETGLYSARDGELEAVTVVGALNAQEYADVRTSAEILKPVVEASAGGIYWTGEAGLPNVRFVRPQRDTAGSDWLGLIANGSYIVTGSRANIPVPRARCAPARAGRADDGMAPRRPVESWVTTEALRHRGLKEASRFLIDRPTVLLALFFV